MVRQSNFAEAMLQVSMIWTLVPVVYIILILIKGRRAHAADIAPDMCFLCVAMFCRFGLVFKPSLRSVVGKQADKKQAVIIIDSSKQAITATL